MFLPQRLLAQLQGTRQKLFDLIVFLLLEIDVGEVEQGPGEVRLLALRLPNRLGTEIEALRQIELAHPLIDQRKIVQGGAVGLAVRTGLDLDRGLELLALTQRGRIVARGKRKLVALDDCVEIHIRRRDRRAWLVEGDSTADLSDTGQDACQQTNDPLFSAHLVPLAPVLVARLARCNSYRRAGQANLPAQHRPAPHSTG
ncbi:hypothetical protein [Bradyrhizobium sp. OK095]|uniref:hypothetical protein n=1 Tax=Bradyrhizobium sp. OK095 TaxID=1882760 RepID=UPI001FCD3CA7|nr:hypothetical protein [Bradyrhizobium sp. OK095]